MLVQLYKIMMIVCIDTLVPNRSFIMSKLPVHQQVYVFQGAAYQYSKELKSKRTLSCTEDSSYCI